VVIDVRSYNIINYYICSTNLFCEITNARKHYLPINIALLHRFSTKLGFTRMFSLPKIACEGNKLKEVDRTK